MSRTLFSDFLTALGVPHTPSYSDKRFRMMTFKSLFGLSKLLTEYGVRNEGLEISDKNEIRKLTPPFLAQSVNGIFVIVNSVDGDMIEYTAPDSDVVGSLDEFKEKWNGIVLLAFPDESSKEPEYSSHRVRDIVSSASGYLLAVFALCVLGYFFVTREVYAHLSTVLIMLLDMAGLYFSYLLLQKSLNIRTAASDRFCGVLEKGGCDSIMQSSASKLFGVFAWSEVGFCYFSVSLATLLMFPHLYGALALFNLFCLPYPIWSIWYQKFKAKHWCTLCVCVQITLILLFVCYLCGGLTARILPIEPDYFILASVYIAAELLLNLLLRSFKKIPCSYEKDS